MPVGRFISGDLIKKNTTDHKGNPITENKHNWWFAIAVEKGNPAVGPLLATIQQKAFEWFPNAQHSIQQGIVFNGFKFKIDDGDDPNQWKGDIGKGCWIFKFSTTQPFGGADNNNVPIDLANIKRGYFVDVAFSISPNSEPNAPFDHTTGLYMNPHTVRLIGYGQEIISGPSIDEQFANAQTGYVPAGMSATPVANPAMQGQNPAMGANPAMQGQNPAMGANPAMQGQNPAMGANPAMQGQNPAMGVNPAMQGQNPAMGANPAMQGQNPAMGVNPAMQGQNPAMGANPAMQGQNPAMGANPAMQGQNPAMGANPAMQGQNPAMGANPAMQGMPGVDPNAHSTYGAPAQNGNGANMGTTSPTNGYNGYMGQ